MRILSTLFFFWFWVPRLRFFFFQVNGVQLRFLPNASLKVSCSNIDFFSFVFCMFVLLSPESPLWSLFHNGATESQRLMQVLCPGCVFVPSWSHALQHIFDRLVFKKKLECNSSWTWLVGSLSLSPLKSTCFQFEHRRTSWCNVRIAYQWHIILSICMWWDIVFIKRKKIACSVDFRLHRSTLY